MKIFVSYARDDFAKVRKIAEVLKRARHDPWIDQISLRAGDRWREKVGKAIAEADAVLVALSKSSVHSEYVQREVDAADEQKKLLIPVRLDDAEIPSQMLISLSGLQWINYADGRGRAQADFAQLLRESTVVTAGSSRSLKSQRPDVVATISIDAPPATVFRVAATFEAYPEWHTGVQSVQVLKTDQNANALVVDWGIGALGATFLRYRVKYSYDAPRRIDWETSRSAMISRMSGSYEFLERTKGRTQAICSSTLRAKVQFPERLRRNLVLQITDLRLTDLKARVESRRDSRGDPED